MPGFILKIGDKYSSTETNKNASEIKFNNVVITSTSINKFKNDNCFYNNNNYSLVLDGVILNKVDLLKEKETWEETIINMYITYGDDFYKKFRGSFSGFIYNKKNDKWIVFADHIGSKHIYYSILPDGYIFSSDIVDIYDFYKENNIKNNISLNSAYMILSYGYPLEDNTLSENIRKILPGNYVKIENNNFSLNEYYRLSNDTNYNLSENEIIEKMDFYFRQAIKRQFDKDLEYGFKHFVALSGGLDSRMTAWVAHEMGYTNQLNYTFSQSNYLDETIPKKIAADLKHEWLFKALDNGLFLKDIDEITKITGGNVLYHGLAHGLSLSKYISFTNLGINHSGQLGDVIFGAFYKKNDENTQFNVGDGAYSKTYVKKVEHSKFEKKYVNQEIFNFYQRGFAGANYGLLATQLYTETMSPFYDVDLIEFALSIPVELRFHHKIYKKWVIKKYPKAADYIWEKTKNRISTKSLNFKNREIYINQLYHILKRKLRISKADTNTKKHMNPLDYWLKTNNEIKLFFDKYYKSKLELLENRELKKDIVELFEKGNSIEKIEVLTILSGVNSMKQ